MKTKLLSLLIGLLVLATQAFATLEDLMDTFRENAPSGFVLTQAHLDAMNKFVGEDVFAFQSSRPLNHTLYNNALSRTFASALTPDNITRATSFGVPSRFRYVLLPYAPTKSDVFMASCASLIQDFDHYGVFDEALLTRVCALPEERLQAMASAHFPPFLLPAVLDNGARIEQGRLPQLAHLFARFLEGDENCLVPPLIIWIMERFQDLSFDQVQCVIDAPLGMSSFHGRCKLLTYAPSFSLEVLPLIPRLFASHQKLDDLFMNLRDEQPSFERLSHITQLPAYLQARHFVSGVDPLNQDEEALHQALCQDVCEKEYAEALSVSRPTFHELSQLDSLGLTPSMRVAALYAKDFLLLEDPDPERYALFVSLMEGLTPFDARLVAVRDLTPHLPTERVHAFNALGLPPHVRHEFSRLFFMGQLEPSQVPAILALMGLYTQDDQRSLAKSLYSLTCLSDKHMDELTQAAFPIDILKDIIRHSSISSSAIDFIKKMTSFFEKSDYPYDIDFMMNTPHEDLPGYHGDLDHKIAQALQERAPLHLPDTGFSQRILTRTSM